MVSWCLSGTYFYFDPVRECANGTGSAAIKCIGEETIRVDIRYRPTKDYSYTDTDGFLLFTCSTPMAEKESVF